jgi:hypothetical protein
MRVFIEAVSPGNDCFTTGLRGYFFETKFPEFQSDVKVGGVCVCVLEQEELARMLACNC